MSKPKSKPRRKPDPLTIISGRVQPAVKAAVDDLSQRQGATRSELVAELLSLGLAVKSAVSAQN